MWFHIRLSPFFKTEFCVSTRDAVTCAKNATSNKSKDQGRLRAITDLPVRATSAGRPINEQRFANDIHGVFYLPAYSVSWMMGPVSQRRSCPDVRDSRVSI